MIEEPHSTGKQSAETSQTPRSRQQRLVSPVWETMALDGRHVLSTSAQQL